MDTRLQYRCIEALARLRKQYCQGEQMDQARKLINDAITEMRKVWKIELPQAGRDVTDFFTYETAKKPDWLQEKKTKKPA